MKKILLVAAVAGLSMVSCKKDYTCECKTTSGSTTATASGATGKMSKKDAEAKCNEGDSSYSSGGISYTTECSIL